MATVLTGVQILNFKTSHLAIGSKVIPPSFSAHTCGGMQPNSCAEHPTMTWRAHTATKEGNKRFCEHCSWGSHISHGLCLMINFSSHTCCSHAFCSMRTRSDSLVSNNMAFFKVSSSCQDTPRFWLQLRKLNSELRSYWAKQERTDQKRHSRRAPASWFQLVTIRNKWNLGKVDTPSY